MFGQAKGGSWGVSGTLAWALLTRVTVERRDSMSGGVVCAALERRRMLSREDELARVEGARRSMTVRARKLNTGFPRPEVSVLKSYLWHGEPAGLGRSSVACNAYVLLATGTLYTMHNRYSEGAIRQCPKENECIIPVPVCP